MCGDRRYLGARADFTATEQEAAERIRSNVKEQGLTEAAVQKQSPENRTLSSKGERLEAAAEQQMRRRRLRRRPQTVKETLARSIGTA